MTLANSGRGVSRRRSDSALTRSGRRRHQDTRSPRNKARLRPFRLPCSPQGHTDVHGMRVCTSAAWAISACHARLPGSCGIGRQHGLLLNGHQLAFFSASNGGFGGAAIRSSARRSIEIPTQHSVPNTPTFKQSIAHLASQQWKQHRHVVVIHYDLPQGYHQRWTWFCLNGQGTLGTLHTFASRLLQLLCHLSSFSSGHPPSAPPVCVTADVLHCPVLRCTVPAVAASAADSPLPRPRGLRPALISDWVPCRTHHRAPGWRSSLTRYRH